MLRYDLSRFSVDLDFDAKRHVELRPLIKMLSGTPYEIDDLNLKKNTDTTQRVMLHFTDKQLAPLKVECSTRKGYSWRI